MEDVAAGMGEAIELEVPQSFEPEFRKALGGLITEERMASPILVRRVSADRLAQMLCRVLGLEGKQARAATEFIVELEDEEAAQFFADDLPEPALDQIVQNPVSPNSLARLFFDLRDA